MESLAMPLWMKVTAGIVLAVGLLGFVGFKAYSDKRGPVIQAYGTTYYDGDGPKSAPLPCKPEGKILSAIASVNAKYDRFRGSELRAFEQRAAQLRGLPPLRIDTLYVITEDDQLRDGKTVLFIGLTSNCVSTVFSFPARLYHELAAVPGDTS